MDRTTEPISRTVLFLVTFACIAVGVWFLSQYSSIFNSIFLAVMIVMTASPIGFWLQDRGAPRWLALLLSLAAALGATVFVAGVLAISALRVLDYIPETVTAIGDAQSRLTPLLSNLGLTLDDVHAWITPEVIGRVARDVIRMTLESVSMFSLVFLIVVFMVIEAFLMPQKFKNRAYLANFSTDTAIDFTLNIRQYVGITSLLGLIGGVVLSLFLFYLDIPFAFLWGVLYLVLNFVPMVGFWIAVIPPLLLAGQSGGASAMLVVLIVYLIVSTIINQGVKPAVMRGGLDLSPFWSIMSLVVWSAILGPTGLIVGVPLTIALKELILQPDPQARWLADLLGSGLPPGQDRRSLESQGNDIEDDATADSESK